MVQVIDLMATSHLLAGKQANLLSIRGGRIDPLQASQLGLLSAQSVSAPEDVD